MSRLLRALLRRTVSQPGHAVVTPSPRQVAALEAAEIATVHTLGLLGPDETLSLCLEYERARDAEWREWMRGTQGFRHDYPYSNAAADKLVRGVRLQCDLAITKARLSEVKSQIAQEGK